METWKPGVAEMLMKPCSIPQAVKRRRCSHVLVAKDSLDSLGSLDSTDEDLLKDLNLSLLDAAKLQESVQSLEVNSALSIMLV